MHGLVLLVLVFDLGPALRLSTLSLSPILILHLCLLSGTYCFNFQSSLLALIRQHLLASGLSSGHVDIFLLFLLLLEQFLNQVILRLLLVETGLSFGLVNGKLSAPTLTLFASKVALLLGLFDFVHGRREGEILDLPWRYAFFLLYFLDCIVDVDVLLDAKLLQVLFKLINTASQLVCRLV